MPAAAGAAVAAGAVAGSLNTEMARLVIGFGAATKAVYSFAGGQAGVGLAAGGVAVASFVAAVKGGYDTLKDFAGAASPNGLKGLDQAAGLLKGTIGSTVLPGFVLLAASVATAADMVKKDLVGSADETAKAWADAVPAFLSLTVSLYDASMALVSFTKNIPVYIDKASKVAGVAGEVGKKGMISSLLGIPGMILGFQENRAKVEGALQEAEDNPKKPDRSLLLDLLKNARMVTSGMKHDMGLKPSFSGSASDVWKRAALAGAMSPFEAKTLQNQAHAVGVLDRMIRHIEKMAG
jgi:hypothetical protein